MDELIIRSLQGIARPAELERLARWRRDSEDNERRYQEVRSLWLLAGQRREFPADGRVPTAGELLADRERRDRRSGEVSRRSVPAWMTGAVAAALVGLLVLGGLRTTVFGPGPSEAAAATFHTGENELETAVLDDGSVVRLAPNTTLEVTMDHDERRVTLDGRAFFAITHDPDRTFEVRTESGEVRVLGTRFDLDTTRRGLRVIVLDGRVGLTAPEGETELGRGELAETGADSRLSVRRVEEPEALLDWLGTWMAFEATPLRDVIRELEIRLGSEIELTRPELAERTVTGWFSERDRDRVLELICRVADLTCDFSGDVVRIR